MNLRVLHQFLTPKPMSQVNTIYSSRIELAHVSQATQHLWSPFVSPPPRVDISPSSTLMTYHYHDTTSVLPNGSESLIFASLCHCSSISTAFYFSSLSLSHIHVLHKSLSLCQRIVYYHHLLVWTVQYPTPINTPISLQRIFYHVDPGMEPTSYTVANGPALFLSLPSLAVEQACHLASASQTSIGTAEDHSHQRSSSGGSRQNLLRLLHNFCCAPHCRPLQSTLVSTSSLSQAFQVPIDI